MHLSTTNVKNLLKIKASKYQKAYNSRIMRLRLMMIENILRNDEKSIAKKKLRIAKSCKCQVSRFARFFSLTTRFQNETIFQKLHFNNTKMRRFRRVINILTQTIYATQTWSRCIRSRIINVIFDIFKFNRWHLSKFTLKKSTKSLTNLHNLRKKSIEKKFFLSKNIYINRWLLFYQFISRFFKNNFCL